MRDATQRARVYEGAAEGALRLTAEFVDSVDADCEERKSSAS